MVLKLVNTELLLLECGVGWRMKVCAERAEPGDDEHGVGGDSGSPSDLELRLDRLGKLLSLALLAPRSRW